MSLFFRVFQHLLPDSIAWRLRKGGSGWTWGDGHTWGQPGLLWGGTVGGRTIERFFSALTNLPASVKQFIDEVYLDLFPSSTRQLAAWEDQFGIQGAPDDDVRRTQLEAAWQASGGQSPKYLQDTVQAAGFDLYIHEWWDPAELPSIVARDPREYTSDPLIGTTQCGEPLAQCGEALAQCNRFLANDPGYLVNSRLSNVAPPAIPSDPDAWPYFLYWGDESFPDHAVVPSSRRTELSRLLLKLCPAEQWLVTLIDYDELALRQPNDPSIFGDLGKGASYIADEQYLELTVDDVDVWANSDNPGTRDLDVTTAPPEWLPSGGVDGNGGVQFDGATEFLVTSNVLTWTTGDRPAMHIVGRYDGSGPAQGYWCGLLAAFAERNTLRRQTTQWQSVYRLGDGTEVVPIVSPAPDTDPHLLESLCYSAGNQFGLDAAETAGALTGGLASAADRFALGAAADGSPSQWEPLTVSEAVVSDDPSTAEVTAYRTLRVAVLYPTIGDAMP